MSTIVHLNDASVIHLSQFPWVIGPDGHGDLNSAVRSISCRKACRGPALSAPRPGFPGPPQRVWGKRQGKENTTPSRVLQHTEETRVFTRIRLESISSIRLWNFPRQNDVIRGNPSRIVALKLKEKKM